MHHIILNTPTFGGTVFPAGLLNDETGEVLGAAGEGGAKLFWLPLGDFSEWLNVGAGAGIFTGGGTGAGGAAGGGGGKELWAGVLTAWLNPLAPPVGAGLSVLDPKFEFSWLGGKLVFGATAGPLGNDCAGAGADVVYWLAGRVRARSSSAQGAGGGRSCSSGGGRKEREGLGAVGGRAAGFVAGADENWLGNWANKHK